MSRATFGPKVLLTFLIWMIDIVCYLFICCLRVAAAWQLLLLLLGLAAAWLLWLGMAAALAWLLWLGCLAWHGCFVVCGAHNLQIYKNIAKTIGRHAAAGFFSPYKLRQASACFFSQPPLLPARAGWQLPSRTVSLRSTGLRLSQNFSTPVSFADSPFQGHTAFTMLRPVAPLLRFSTKTSLTLHHDR